MTKRLSDALLTALGVFGFVVALAIARHDPSLLQPALWLGVMAGSAVAAVPTLITVTVEVAVNVAELLSQRDLDSDGDVGEPGHDNASAESIRLIPVTSAASHRTTEQTTIAPAGFDMERFRAFVYACERKTSVRALRTEGFTDTEITAYTGLIRQYGFCRTVSSDGSMNNGWEMARSASEVLGALFPTLSAAEDA